MVKNYSSSEGFNPSPNQFIMNIFNCKLFYNGGVIRRSQTSLIKLSCEESLINAANSNGMSVYRTKKHYLLIPKDDDLLKLN